MLRPQAPRPTHGTGPTSVRHPLRAAPALTGESGRVYMVFELAARSMLQVRAGESVLASVRACVHACARDRVRTCTDVLAYGCTQDWFSPWRKSWDQAVGSGCGVRLCLEGLAGLD